MTKTARVTMVQHINKGWTVQVDADIDEWGIDRSDHYFPFGDSGYYEHVAALRVATEVLKELERLGYAVTRCGATAAPR